MKSALIIFAMQFVTASIWYVAGYLRGQIVQIRRSIKFHKEMHERWHAYHDAVQEHLELLEKALPKESPYFQKHL